MKKILGGACFMRKNFTSKLIVWLGWSVIWILMNKILYTGGLVYGKTLFQLLVECFLSVLAAEMMCHSIALSLIMIALLTIKLVSGFGVVTMMCYVVSIGLFIVTRILTPKATTKK